MSPYWAELLWGQSVREFMDGAREPSPEMKRQLDAMRNQLFRDVVEMCAEKAEAWADNYPKDIFPEEGKTPDCESAKFARHTAKMIAKSIRELGEDYQ